MVGHIARAARRHRHSGSSETPFWKDVLFVFAVVGALVGGILWVAMTVLDAQSSPSVHSTSTGQELSNGSPKPATVDTPLSEAAVLKIQLAGTTLERDLLQIDAQAREAKLKARSVYQQAIQGIAGKDCSIVAGPEGKPTVRRCPVEKP